MSILSDLYKDLKWLIIAALVVVLLLGAWILKSVYTDPEIRNVGWVLVGFSTSIVIVKNDWMPLILLIPFAILWLIFGWWWIIYFLAAYLALEAGGTANLSELAKTGLMVPFVVIILYPFTSVAREIDPHPYWQITLVVLIAVVTYRSL